MAISLKSISRNHMVRAPRVLLYGPHGIGKSTFGASAPSPIFIQTEDGLGTLDVPHFPLAKTHAEVIDAIGALYAEQHDFSTVVVDSLDWLDTLIWDDINAKHDAKDLAYGKGAVIAAGYWQQILEGMNALRNDKGMAVILLAHAQVKRFDSPEVEPFDRYSPKLQERSSALIQEWCDAVFFANFKLFITKTNVGFNNQVSRGMTTGERVMYAVERPAFLAKNRFSLPEAMELSWQDFAQYLNPAAKAANPQE